MSQPVPAGLSWSQPVSAGPSGSQLVPAFAALSPSDGRAALHGAAPHGAAPHGAAPHGAAVVTMWIF